MSAVEETSNINRPGVVVLRNSVIKRVPKVIMRSRQETSEQTPPRQGVISIVHGSENYQVIGEKAEARVKTSEADVSQTVTHIEIIRQKPAVKSKHGTSRRVTGANRVVPLITSMWQKRKLKAVEPSLADTYKTILNDLDNTDKHECEACQKQFLSATQVEHHFKEEHHQHVVSEQCFVCRKRYVFESQLKSHLSAAHGIQYPEMICKICFMEFNTPMEQRAHERKHDKIYSCQYCSTKFASEYFCQRHYNQHLVNMKPHPCSSCGKRFRNSISLGIHWKRHKSLMCWVCNVLFESDLKLVMHIKEHSAECREQFMSVVEEMDHEETQLEDMLGTYFRTNVAKHQVAGVDKDVSDCMEGLLCSVSQTLDAGIPTPEPHTEKRGMECKLCGLEVDSPKELVDHRRYNHVRSCTCLVCGKRSRSVSQTLRHMTTHIDKVKTSPPNKPNKNEQQCHVCSKTFVTKGKRNFHLEQVHKIETIQRPHACTVCSRKFQHKTSRDRHMLLHSTDKSTLNLKCTVCDQVFLRPKFLLRHMAGHESHNECPVCKKTFSTRRQLKLHLNGHTQAALRKKFKCSICSVTCQGVAGLREHVRIHTGERPFVCSLCDGSFKRLQALKKHIGSVHHGPGAASHPCTSCSMIFNNRGNLLRHFLRVHRGLRRFICGVCGMHYGQNQDLRRHLKVKHQVEMPVISCVDKKSVNEIYVLPPIDKIPKTHPHAEKINKLVAEEKRKLDYLGEVKRNKHSIGKLSSDSPNEDKMATCSTTQPYDSSVEGKQRTSEMCFSQLVPCTKCHRLLQGDVCNKCVPPAEMVVTLYRCGVCMMDFLDSNALTTHMDERHLASEMLTESNCGINSVAASQEQVVKSVVTPSNMEMLCPPGNLFVLQPQATLPLAIAQHNILVKTTPVFTLQPPVLTIPQVSTVVTLGSPLQPPIEMFADPAGETLLQTLPSAGISKVPIPKLSSHKIFVKNKKTQVEVKQMLDAKNRSVKTPTEELDCKQCGKTFVNSTRLERHLKTHVGQRPFSCPQCSKCFSEKHNLKVHMRTHTGERPYTCTECGKQMRYQKDFADHKKQHLGMKPFKCAECGQCFLRQRELVRHKTTHTGEKKYKCPICDKAFARLDQLKLVHMRNHDATSGPFPFTCTICDKGFRVKGKLEQHQILHSGEKNHHCPICEKVFALDVYLKSHLKTHKKQHNYVQCCKCPRRFASQQTLQVHDETFHARLQKTAKKSREGNKKKQKRIMELPETALSEPPLDIAEIEEVDLLEGEDILVDDKCDAVIYLQMVPGDLDLPLNNDV